MIAGIDVSHWNGRINWQTAKAAGALFMFAKATQGLTYVDDTYRTNAEGAKAAGVLRGAYHFYDYQQFGKPQAGHFWAHIKDDNLDLPPVMDLELYWQPYPSGKNLLIAARDFITELDNLSGRSTMLYTNPAMIALFVASGVKFDWLKDHPLWIAHYTTASAPTFQPWPAWTFWQTSGNGDGHKYGCEGKGVDMNVFNGDLAALRRFCGLDATAPEPDPVPLTLEQRVARLENAARREGWVL